MHDREFVDSFIKDTSKSLHELDEVLFKLKKNPNEKESLNHLFRIFHTIKGTSGFLQFIKIENIAHITENLLSQLLADEAHPEEDIIDLFLEVVGVLRILIQNIESQSKEMAPGYVELVDKIICAQVEQKTMAPSEEVLSDDELESLFDATKEAIKDDEQGLYVQQEEQPHDKTTQSIQVENTIQIKVETLDAFLNNITQLVMVRNQMQDLNVHLGSNELNHILQHLNRITSNLQEKIMISRMQPLSTLWSKLPRVVFEVSKQLDKSAELHMSGENTNVDRSVLEALKDPMMHIIRNAIDHGIESPQEREKLRKSKTGNIYLRAYHQDGEVCIEVEDDGKGIDLDNLKNQVIQKGLFTPYEISRMSKKEVLDLIFLPGFTTKKEISNISGRGVGMDVVRTNIEKIGGRISMRSKKGQGSLLKLKLPLTLAIVHHLMVKCQEQYFSIIEQDVLEIIKLPSELYHLENINGMLTLNYHQNILYVLDLNHLFFGAPMVKPYKDEKYGIIMSHAGTQYVILVDKIEDTQESVSKPLNQYLRNIKAFAGATLTNMGTISLIIDSLGLAEMFGIENTKEIQVNQKTLDIQRDDYDSSYVLFTMNQEQFAIEFDDIERFEVLDQNQIIQQQDKYFFNFHDELVQIIPLFGTLNTPDETKLALFKTPHQDIIALEIGQDVNIKKCKCVNTQQSPNALFDKVCLIEGTLTHLIHPQGLSNARERL